MSWVGRVPAAAISGFLIVWLGQRYPDTPWWMRFSTAMVVYFVVRWTLEFAVWRARRRRNPTSANETNDRPQSE